MNELLVGLNVAWFWLLVHFKNNVPSLSMDTILAPVMSVIINLAPTGAFSSVKLREFFSKYKKKWQDLYIRYILLIL